MKRYLDQNPRDATNRLHVAALEVLVLVLILVGAVTAPILAACGPNSPVPVIGQAAIDCTKANQDKIEAAFHDGLSLLPDWSAIYQRAREFTFKDGVEIGGCALAMLVQHYLGGYRAVDHESGWAAHRALETFRREEADGATFLVEYEGRKLRL